tara:strand:+ start:2661 stop:4574 length:1914 start_codon:yes stop_codon:yes gene_type:complete
MSTSRYLTKSRFKLALDCPTKLFYTRKSEYENQSDTDSFLEGLAQGGFQVEELARMEHPNGVAITGDDYNYQRVANRTQELLKQENISIFEPAFLIDGLFIRVDILVKKGNRIQLIEVKAKSISSNSHNSFINSKGNLGGGWDTYLYDIAFQKYVMQLCYPEWEISASLKLVDKDATTSVNGLHTCFKIVSDSDLRTGIVKKEGITREDLGDSILCAINVNEEIDLILTKNPVDETRSFPELVNFFREHYQTDTKIFTEIDDEQLMHMKFCVIDYKTVISGSANWSKSAFTKHNEEVTIVKENLTRANDFMNEFERLKDISGKIKSIKKELDISRAMKTFQVIKALINIGDTQTIQPYIYQLKNISELNSVTKALLNGDYDNAVKEIELFIANYTQIVSVSEIEKSQILIQIKLLSYQLEIMEFEKVEKEAMLEQFNHRYILELNPLISKVLELKKKIYNKLKKHGIVDDTFEKIDEEFKRRNQEYESEKEIEIPDLNQDDTKTLKQCYKEASKLCHPDSLECIYEDKEEAAQVFAELSTAYKVNDLEKVRYILNELKLGKPISNLNEFDELVHLRTRLETLKVKYDKLQFEIQEIITSETFIIIVELEEWDVYFEQQKILLENEFENLTAKYTNNE